ncbi:Delta-aminolevulinic acid dehydratase [Ruminiclostridium cellobioparum subsp. termitidis CT1112]|uniref:Delta-aminolevulinic acid dehydratase n=1 Tax=Ruminiclostridium cellobioparum subsp. termitidis CT1112 TaxID=1195236 RepID=S0FHA8_RUMCE|nr:Delta-aminolevulinic acid dehydratase [Ruminiclostridium cellobioparum subsp. termitidis CT1112]
MDLIKRPRRLRTSPGLRKLVRETNINVEDFIYPMFVAEGAGIEREIASMPGINHYSVDRLLFQLEKVQKAGIPGVLLFGVPDEKDEVGTGAFCSDGIVQKALRQAKQRFPELVLSADLCLCEYTSHGHCGIIKDNKIDNDLTLEVLAKAAVSLADAGADIIAPSDMMDGRVAAIRKALDGSSFTDKAIMAYSAKYASAFYGPFRDAAGSAPAFGDRKTYQMDYHGRKEAMKEIELDIDEGADIIMVKPALAYLDIIHEAASRYDYPLAAYNVSGEYCMIKAAAGKGWIDEKGAALESLTAIKRAGAVIIISYFAIDAAAWLK